jgi:hypothetical protein
MKQLYKTNDFQQREKELPKKCFSQQFSMIKVSLSSWNFFFSFILFNKTDPNVSNIYPSDHKKVINLR